MTRVSCQRYEVTCFIPTPPLNVHVTGIMYLSLDVELRGEFLRCVWLNRGMLGPSLVCSVVGGSETVGE